MVDMSTIHSLELLQNLHMPKSKNSLFGLLNNNLTPMGARKLRNTLLQPSTDKELLKKRYEAVGELSQKEDVFFAVRQGDLPKMSCLNIVLTTASLERICRY